MSQDVCPHCGLPPVLPEVCTPEVNAAIQQGIERDGEMFYDGMKHEAAHQIIAKSTERPT
jgi:hypothetical protein